MAIVYNVNNNVIHRKDFVPDTEAPIKATCSIGIGYYYGIDPTHVPVKVEVPMLGMDSSVFPTGEGNPSVGWLLSQGTAVTGITLVQARCGFTYQLNSSGRISFLKIQIDCKYNGSSNWTNVRTMEFGLFNSTRPRFTHYMVKTGMNYSFMTTAWNPHDTPFVGFAFPLTVLNSDGTNDYVVFWSMKATDNGSSFSFGDYYSGILLTSNSQYSDKVANLRDNTNTLAWYSNFDEMTYSASGALNEFPVVQYIGSSWDTTNYHTVTRHILNFELVDEGGLLNPLWGIRTEGSLDSSVPSDYVNA